MNSESKERISKVTFTLIYWFAAILITICLTPLLAHIFSKEVTAFEGTKGYVYIGLIVTFGLFFAVTSIVTYIIWLLRRISKECKQRRELNE
ncbi:MAG: hypothetical protein OQJ80_07315 [Kangiella sp.]|jgi:uncharacterized membrane protein|nr:hypothetical protein [Kangiella sp.]